MMKMMTSREDRATMTAMIGMSSDWLLSCGVVSVGNSIPGSVVVSVSSVTIYPSVSGVGVSESRAVVSLSPPAGVGGGGSVADGA